MPNSFTHLVLGKEYINKKIKNNLNNIDLNNFFLGCVIPDINHISHLERKITHFYDDNVFEFFEPKNDKEYSFCLGYDFHIKIDNLWKYKIRLKYNISLEENLKIYNYFDYCLKEKYSINYNYFENYVLKGRCNLLRKLGVDDKVCKEWKRYCIDYVKNNTINYNNMGSEKYRKYIDEFLDLVHTHIYLK
ncbi:MAG: hypothetical protein PWP15_1601 [Methanothermococcus sp.]|uniref:hypothetical protein n=1 Tax=Methanothermococcus sp. TaxID=2614238 RepID=UPI00258C8686|nr:hypothetical protein [Methanothermococcus sp.]MDK2791081.1 hypothetical protein [Methanothermococcus sp.]MDK2988122.1 hypothetical protein [Methanothermococcus sp.]